MNAPKIWRWMRTRFRFMALLCVLFFSIGVDHADLSHAAFDTNITAQQVDSLLPAGRYLLKTKVVAAANLPVIGRVDSTTRTLAWVDIEHRGGLVVGRQKICQVALGDERDLARTIFPDSLIHALPVKRIRFELSPAALFPMKLEVDLGEETMGYRATSPGAPLPRSAQAAEVVDVDKDGRPGATLFLDLPGIGRYPLGIVSKGHTRLEGWLHAPGFAKGSATLLQFQQRVLSGLPVKGEVRDVKGIPERSSFELAPLGPGVGCAELSAYGLSYGDDDDVRKNGKSGDG